jgi:hypothetical protein
MKPRERDVERYFKEQVEKAGGQHRKVRWLDQRGAPDQFAFGFATGRFSFCEIKRPGEPLKPHQDREAKKLRTALVPYCMIDSVEVVDAFIERMMS